MLKEGPDHRDAELVLKIYDLRREPVMRESRSAVMGKYWPKNAEEAVAITKPDHPMNTAYRQTAGYWEMVYGMAKHGVIHTEFLVDNNGEGLFLFARVEPHLEALRQATSSRAFQNAEWVVKNSVLAAQMMETFRARVQKALKDK